MPRMSSSDAKRLMAAAVTRSKRSSSVQLPIAFARVPDGQTPLKHIQQDGRGEGLRLRLFLLMVMMATAAPHRLRPYVAPAFAKTLDLADPEKEGARRVNQSQRWLAQYNYISRDTTQRPMVVTILNCDRSGTPWSGASGKRWITVPLELWTNGWILELSGRGLALYIVLRELTGGKAAGASVPGRRRKEYGLSYETWKRGCDELEELGLLQVERERVSDDEDWGLQVHRNVYRLIPDGLTRPLP